MSNNKQSSVEWLIEQLKEYDFSEEDDNYVIKIQSWVLTEKHEQAKAMHKSEIIWAHGIKMKGVNNHKCVSGEQYYNQTFGDESNN